MLKVDKILPKFIEEGFELFEISKLKMIYIFCFYSKIFDGTAKIGRTSNEKDRTNTQNNPDDTLLEIHKNANLKSCHDSR